MLKILATTLLSVLSLEATGPASSSVGENRKIGQVSSDTRAQDFSTVVIVGLDYAYQAPTTLAAGPTAFAFENHGKVRHEVSMVRLRPGITVDSMIHAESAAARQRMMEGVGILIADPGTGPLGRILVDLAPGETYVIYCSFQDASDKPRHMTMGMITSFQVR